MYCWADSRVLTHGMVTRGTKEAKDRGCAERGVSHADAHAEARALWTFHVVLQPPESYKSSCISLLSQDATNKR